MVQSLSALACLLLLQGAIAETPHLRVGQTLRGEIADSDPVVHTPALDRSMTDAPVVGKSYVVRVDEPGTYTIELRSYFFDAYLVLRTEAGEILAEDDDGLLGTHSRIVVELTPGMHQVDVCALQGGRGALELKILRGRPAELSPSEQARARRAELQQALAVIEAVRGSEHLDTAVSSNELADLLLGQGDLAAARPYYERALAIREKVLGPEHESLAPVLHNLASCLVDLGESEQAQPLYERALAIAEATLGPAHTVVALILTSLGSLLAATGNGDEALPLLERSLAVLEPTVGPTDAFLAKALDALAPLLEARGEREEACSRYEQLLAIREKQLGPDHPDTAWTCRSLGNLLTSLGRPVEAEPYLARVPPIFEQTYGAEHAYLAYGCTDLGRALAAQQRVAEAEPLFRRALQIVEQARPPGDAYLAACRADLVQSLKARGRYEEAQQICERELAILEAALGPDHPDVARSLDNLALFLWKLGRYEEAHPLYERALTIREATLGPDHPEVALSSNNLGLLLFTQDKFEEAQALFERALAIRQKLSTSDDSFALPLSLSLRNLAAVREIQGKHEEALSLIEQAVAIRERLLGPEHADLVEPLVGLANILENRGRYEEARRLYERGLAIWERARGQDSYFALCLFQLAKLFHDQGEYAQAGPLYEQVLAIEEKVWGPRYPSATATLSWLTRLDLDTGEPSEALARVRLLLDRQREYLLSQISTAAESDALRYASRLKNSVQVVLSVLEATGTDSSVEGYEAVCSWKGLVSQLFGKSRLEIFAALSPEQQSTLERLRAIQAGLSNALALREIDDPTAHAANLEWLRKESDRLSAELQRSKAATPRQEPVRVPAIAAALPPGSAWVDFVEHDLWVPAQWQGGELAAPGTWSAPMLSAWIVMPGGELTHVSLGESAPIREAVVTFLEGTTRERDLLDAGADERGFAAGENREDPQAPANERVRSLLWDPLAALLADSERIFVCPDVFLATLPFEIIEDADDRFLVEKHAFVYLQDAAALLDLKDARSPVEPTLLAVGAIDYDRRDESPPKDLVASLRRGNPNDGDFDYGWLPLSETRREVEGISRFHRQRFEALERRLLTEDEASEENLKAGMPRHSVIHLATHGYFEPAALPSAWEKAKELTSDETGPGLRADLGLEHRLVTGYLPGLLSGLVCAGANADLDPARDNGLLTAEEASWLDLSGCDLVVLSACQTALGTSRSGEGMRSLRHAFHQAGARTVISSLWNVGDDSTRRLMLAFYDRLWNQGLGKAAALRTAQIEMLDENRRNYDRALPATWGAFVLSGDWR